MSGAPESPADIARQRKALLDELDRLDAAIAVEAGDLALSQLQSRKRDLEEQLNELSGYVPLNDWRG